MPLDPLSLLRRLEPPVRPGASPESGRQPDAPLDAQPFDRLLALVSSGAVRSGRAVDVRADLASDLTPEQWERLAAAADLAEAHGAATALMLIDGRGLVMDVPARRVASELSDDEPARVVQLDAAVYVAGAEREPRDVILPPAGGGVVAPAVIAQLLAGTAERVQPTATPREDTTPEPRRAAG